MRRLMIVIGAIVWLAASHSPALAEPRMALVVGNAGYESIPPLKNSVNDARMVPETLRGLPFKVEVATDASRSAIARAIRDFGQRLRSAGPQAVGLFYYAGRGVRTAGSTT